METILAVDENKSNLELLTRVLENKYKLITAGSYEESYRILTKSVISLILISDNFEIMEKLQKSEEYKNIPIIFITSVGDKDRELKAFKMGAMDFIISPFESDVIITRIERTIELCNLRNNLREEVNSKTKEIENITLQTLTTIANTVDSKDSHAKNHSVTVAKISEEIARQLNWDEDRITNLYHIALLHDIGKISMPDSLFNNPEHYTREEYDLIKTHVKTGSEILEGLSISNAQCGARYHHERYDGTGYSLGLKGEEIPIEARIIAVADAFDAMASNRSYRNRMTKDEIIEEFLKCRGKQFDPEVADIMIEMVKNGSAFRIRSTRIITERRGIVGESTKLLEKVMTEYAAEVQTDSCKDSLTGLWNRKYTIKKVDEILDNPQAKGAAFMVDIDNFKAINDNYGHIFGDQIIVKIASTLKDFISEQDIICRIGGDEFFIFLNEISDSTEISAKAGTIINKLYQEVKYPDLQKGVAASIGIAVSPKDGNNFLELYASADKALYYAKNNGKSTYHFFSDEAENDIEDRTSIQKDLNYITQMLLEKGPVTGSYYVEYEGFKNISHFLHRNITRNEKDAAYILFTITSDKGPLPGLESMQQLMQILENSIRDSLRVGDVATRYSSSQMVVILMDANEINSKMVAGRVFAEFNRRSVRIEDVILHYDVQLLVQPNKERK